MSRSFIALLLFFLAFTACKNKEQKTSTESPQNVESTTTTPEKIESKEPEPKPYILQDVEKINKLISDNKYNTLQQIAKAYYTARVEGIEGETINFIEEEEKPISRITIVHDNIPDDSVRGVKIVMLIKEDLSEVVEIRKSIRCYAGRGHGMWSGEDCN